ncbi:hypothetical protein ABB27_02435 [Stenotrophomonas terrae]|uniref:Uncharacterized protein n=1 Tax=Stenotrophomonas terrae TaxID=405446 RepID=A0A0R0D316_9GAMM|nr:hypothetical protein [Stenotrophomonas terrae]KRG71768.1 hypothetical protein ABB27_02435 [Stenotrophomonas terrae]
MPRETDQKTAHSPADDVLWGSVIVVLVWAFVAFFTRFFWRGSSASPVEAILTFLSAAQVAIFIVSCLMTWALVRLLGRLLGGGASNSDGKYFGRLALAEIGSALTTVGALLIACTILGGGVHLLIGSFVAHYYGYLFKSEFGAGSSFKV